MGEKSVGEKYMVDRSVGEKYMSEKYMCERLWVKSLWVKNGWGKIGVDGMLAFVPPFSGYFANFLAHQFANKLWQTDIWENSVLIFWHHNILAA